MDWQPTKPPGPGLMGWQPGWPPAQLARSPAGQLALLARDLGNLNNHDKTEKSEI